MDFLDLPQITAAAGRVRLPGSKSISNRALLLSALAEGPTRLVNLLASDDTARMQEALTALGVPWENDGAALVVHGVAGRFPVRQAELFLGNAGTAFRSLTAALAFADGNYTLSGIARMHERPIGDLVDALRLCGAKIDYLEQQGFPPLAIHPATIAPGATIPLRGDISSQFLSGLLMALPLTGQAANVEIVGELISKPYVDLTLALMARFGVTVEREGYARFHVPAKAHYVSPGDYRVEGDASSASYFLALGALAASEQAPLIVEGIGKDALQGDVAFAQVLQQMGAHIDVREHEIAAWRPAQALLGITLDANAIPDAAMTLAPLALFAQGPTTIQNVASWRVKETDRLAAMATELQKLGATVEEGADFLRITPPAGGLQPAAIDTYDDHRMAMCFSLASAGTPVRIHEPRCVAKTWPDYFARFAERVSPVPVIAIDGPTASGKGTVAARLAQSLGFHYLDSGALYRLTALAAQQAGLDWADEAALAALARRLPVEFRDNQIWLAGDDVTQAIRAEAISAAASRIAVLPAVRAALLFRQRAFARAPGLVADGRDMGSTVFPQATLKVFLTASAKVRAQRRFLQLNETVPYADILADLEARDERDRNRAAAPLKQTEDAHLLETDDLPIEACVDRLRSWHNAETFDT